jgi:hemolysin activation/secretion protein
VLAKRTVWFHSSESQFESYPHRLLLQNHVIQETNVKRPQGIRQVSALACRIVTQTSRARHKAALTGTYSMPAMQTRLLARFCLVPLLLWDAGALQKVLAAELAATNYLVSSYVVAGYQVPETNSSTAMFARYTGRNVGLSDLVKAACALQSDYRSRGYTNVSISLAPERIANGLVTLHAFRAPSGDILVSGKRFPKPNDLAGPQSQPPPSQAATPKTAAAACPSTSGATNAAAAARANPTPHFAVQAFEVRGDTLLSTEALTAVLAKHTGTNVVLTNILAAASDLQAEYRNRGYPTVRVTIPQQQVTNQMVKLQVFEGRLSDIQVTKNRFFSSNNVMRALPSLRTNMILNSVAFQAELDRANANQDRQIYPQLSPGPEENTTLLTLEAKDRLPLHGKIELNDQNSPGTPDLRVNSSAVYNNLWQLEHSLGVQYSFSPESFKSGDQWAFFDRPQVANYSAFYRLPLGSPESIADVIASSPGSFGYDEATRTFHLPPPSGRAELNLYASRSTIDSGVMTLFNGNLYNTNGNSLNQQTVQRDLTVNSAIGARLSLPLRSTASFRSSFSGGFDFKTFDLTSNKTNIFNLSSTEIDYGNDPSHPQTNINHSVDVSPVPTTHHLVEYVPLVLRYDGSLRDSRGVTTFGLGMSANSWFSGAPNTIEGITGSSHSSGYWLVLTPSLGRDLVIQTLPFGVTLPPSTTPPSLGAGSLINTNWVLSLRADGQLANQPLVPNEQFGLGGLAGVRGYHEGEVFGDDGWRITTEQKTPDYVVGTAYRNHPLTIRGSVFMDYGEAYLVDPGARKARTPLWGVGFGGVASIGPTWEARFLFSWPLLSAGTTEAGQPRFDFGLSAQF